MLAHMEPHNTNVTHDIRVFNGCCQVNLSPSVYAKDKFYVITNLLFFCYFNFCVLGLHKIELCSRLRRESDVIASFLYVMHCVSQYRA